MSSRFSQLRLVAAAAISIALMASHGIGIGNAQTASDKWTTPWAKKLGVQLEKTFDSSGPDAWNPKEHPLVFITTEGPGYGGLLSGVKLPGLVIIDANTKKVVTSQSYDVLSWGWKSVFEPHGLGVSPDGKWLYLPTGEGSFATQDHGRLLIINARTLKVDKVLKLQSNAHHAKAFRRPDGKQLVLIESFAGGHQPTFVLDPADDNKVVGGIASEELERKTSYLSFVSPNGREVFIGLGGEYTPPATVGGRQTWVARIDTTTWKRKGDLIPIPDGDVIWTAFTSDGKYAYIDGADASNVFKYDRAQDKVVAYAHAGVQGPYGIHFGWDDRYLYTVGKGEASHNRGKVIGLVDTALMGKPGGALPMDEFTTNCVRGDHATLHPDPDANELWISCNASFEVVVFDVDQKKVTARIATPHGGSTHSGAFVKYTGWNGEVLSDQNGLHGSALATKRRLLGLAKSENRPIPASKEEGGEAGR